MFQHKSFWEKVSSDAVGAHRWQKWKQEENKSCFSRSLGKIVFHKNMKYHEMESKSRRKASLKFIRKTFLSSVSSERQQLLRLSVCNSLGKPGNALKLPMSFHRRKGRRRRIHFNWYESESKGRTNTKGKLFPRFVFLSCSGLNAMMTNFRFLLSFS